MKILVPTNRCCATGTITDIVNKLTGIDQETFTTAEQQIAFVLTRDGFAKWEEK